MTTWTRGCAATPTTSCTTHDLGRPAVAPPTACMTGWPRLAPPSNPERARTQRIAPGGLSFECARQSPRAITSDGQDLATGDAGARIARHLRDVPVGRRAWQSSLTVVALAQVVWVRMYHERSPDDRVGPRELDQRINDCASRHSVVVCDDVAQVAHMPLFIRGRAVQLVEWVVVWARTEAAIREVRLLVDVETVCSGAQAFDAI
mmetsp:Transcript_40192/g.91040  ORF Transcript_40192/g.91040 Transcript_40192/m.91040 type:complete len:205 (-) Transcript_40192:314-928(-)